MNYKIEEILEAARVFAAHESAQKLLEINLRRIEGKKQKVNEEKVEIVSHETLVEAMERIMHGATETVAAIIEKFNQLGYKVIES